MLEVPIGENMFTDDEMNEIVGRFQATLDGEKAGKARERNTLAIMLATIVRDYLRGRYNAGNEQKSMKTGIVQLKDVLGPEDFKRD